MNNFESNRKMKINYFILFLLLKLNFSYSQEASDLSSLSRNMEMQNDSERTKTWRRDTDQRSF